MTFKGLIFKIVILIEVVLVAGALYYGYGYIAETPAPVVYTEDGRKCTVSADAVKVCVDA